MNAAEVWARMVPIIAEKLAVAPEKVLPKANALDDLGADSLDIVEVVMEIEDVFHVELPDEDMEGFTNLGQLRDLVVDKLNPKAA